MVSGYLPTDKLNFLFQYNMALLKGWVRQTSPGKLVFFVAFLSVFLRFCAVLGDRVLHFRYRNDAKRDVVYFRHRTDAKRYAVHFRYRTDAKRDVVHFRYRTDSKR